MGVSKEAMRESTSTLIFKGLGNGSMAVGSNQCQRAAIDLEISA